MSSSINLKLRSKRIDDPKKTFQTTESLISFLVCPPPPKSLWVSSFSTTTLEIQNWCNFTKILFWNPGLAKCQIRAIWEWICTFSTLPLNQTVKFQKSLNGKILEIFTRSVEMLIMRLCYYINFSFRQPDLSDDLLNTLIVPAPTGAYAVFYFSLTSVNIYLALYNCHYGPLQGQPQVSLMPFRWL